MEWFGKSKKLQVARISSAIDPPKPAPVALLNGDEDASTPVEDSALGKLARLHPFSPVAVSVLQLFDREEASTHEIANLLQSDPALAAEILAYVNSPLFAHAQSITELRNAVLIVGAENTKRIAATLAMRVMLKSAPRMAVTRRLWRHSFATGLIAAEFAPVYDLPVDLAHTAGVLHDIGRIGLLAKDGEAYEQLVLRLYDGVDGILAAEGESCGMDHCAAGSYLCRAWALPAVFQETAAGHHQAAGEGSIPALVHAACAMADDMAFAAISHRRVLPVADRIAECVPEALRERALAIASGIEARIAAKVDALDF